MKKMSKDSKGKIYYVVLRYVDMTAVYNLSNLESKRNRQEICDIFGKKKIGNLLILFGYIYHRIGYDNIFL